MMTLESVYRAVTLPLLAVALTASPAAAHPGHAGANGGWLMHHLAHLITQIDGWLALVAALAFAAAIAAQIRRWLSGRARAGGAQSTSHAR